MTTTDLSVYDKFPDPNDAINQLGRTIALSGCLGTKNEHTAKVLALHCFATRTTPLIVKQRYHVMYEQLSMKWQTMLADFRTKENGSHRIIERTPEVSEIELTIGTETNRFRFTWEEAKAEPYIYLTKGKPKTEPGEDWVIDQLEAGKPPKMKPKYRTPRSRMQMLWARVVSDGVDAMAPEVTAGAYTPEQISDFEVAPEEDELPHDDMIDAEYEVSSDDSTTAFQADPPREADGEAEKIPEVNSVDDTITAGFCRKGSTKDQRDKIHELAMQLDNGSNDGPYHLAVSKALAKDNVTSMQSWTQERATEVLSKLQAKWDEIKTSESVGDLITAGTEKGLKRMLAEYEQAKPGVVGLTKCWLSSIGKKKLADLSVDEARGLSQAMEAKQVEDFFGDVLTKGSQQ